MFLSHTTLFSLRIDRYLFWRTDRPGVEVLKLILLFFVLTNFMCKLNSLIEIHIWHVSPQLNCGDTGQIWRRHALDNRLYDKYPRIVTQYPHPWFDSEFLPVTIVPTVVQSSHQSHSLSNGGRGVGSFESFRSNMADEWYHSEWDIPGFPAAFHNVMPQEKQYAPCKIS